MRIASRIADGEFQENTRISGRSTLSSEYQVSPETVRKALNLLADMDIVRTVEGSGTIVLSAEKAEKYLETVSVRGEQSDLHSRLQGLLREYTRSSRQIYDVGARLIAAGTSPLPSEKTLPNYEVRVPDDSDKIGMSIGDLRFWQCTGATIVAVRRGQSVTVSPGPYLELRAGDVLVYVGAPGCRQAVEQLLGGGHTDRSLYNIQQRKNKAKILRGVPAHPGTVYGQAARPDRGRAGGVRADRRNRHHLFRGDSAAGQLHHRSSRRAA
jgi:K+/H+ antiporter YhaU regulatory subunit KhtT